MNHPDSIVSTAVNELLCEKLANLIRHTEALREGSFDGKRYGMTIGAAAKEACKEVPLLAPWLTTAILVCYTETDEFCRKVLKTEPAQVSPSPAKPKKVRKSRAKLKAVEIGGNGLVPLTVKVETGS